VQYLGTNESRILKYLVQHPNQIVRRHELHDYVWRQQGFEVDDSSLTQAVSTLRKSLNDSIKSPIYIKTVPKQGYQWIADVESTSLVKKQKLIEKQDSESAVPEDSLFSVTEETNPTIDSQPKAAIQTDPFLTITKRRSWLNRILVAIALAIPLITIYALDVHQPDMEPVKLVNGIELVSPPSHPDISAWLPTIERCINDYDQGHQNQSKPIQVIATAGQEDKLILNFIYPSPSIDLSTTLVLFANQHESSNICQ
jgi:cholera toxin transcriptional activator